MAGAGKEYDRHDLHRYLWKRADRHGRVLIHQREWAEDLGITHFSMSRIISQMKEAGRIKKVGARRGGMGVYVIRDPESNPDWAPLPVVPKKKAPRVKDSDGVGGTL